MLSIVADASNRWTPASYSGTKDTENPNARFPRLTYGENKNNNQASTFWIADGSYVRLKNLQIGYTIPSSITKKITLNNLRVFVAAQNLFTITGYSGLDPEIGEFNQNPIYKGVDMGYYPQARTFMFGISMKL